METFDVTISMIAVLLISDWRNILKSTIRTEFPYLRKKPRNSWRTQFCRTSKIGNFSKVCICELSSVCVCCGPFLAVFLNYWTSSSMFVFMVPNETFFKKKYRWENEPRRYVCFNGLQRGWCNSLHLILQGWIGGRKSGNYFVNIRHQKKCANTILKVNLLPWLLSCQSEQNVH